MTFFFSSRRRHTRLQGDWSSDVCSSDLPASGIAAAISAPALYAMHATPRTILDDFREMVRRMTLQELRVIGEFGELVAFDVMYGVGEGHFSKKVMVAIALAIGGDVHELWPLPSI